MFSVPLRRALVTGSDLPYPEGVAAAEVLKVGFGSAEGKRENAKGLHMIILGSVISAGYALLAAMRLAASDIACLLYTSRSLPFTLPVVWLALGGTILLFACLLYTSRCV